MCSTQRNKKQLVTSKRVTVKQLFWYQLLSRS